MKTVLKRIALPIVSFAELIVMIGSLLSSIANYILSFIVGLAALCTIGAFVIGQNIAWLFLAITVSFFILMVFGEVTTTTALSWIANVKMKLKST